MEAKLLMNANRPCSPCQPIEGDSAAVPARETPQQWQEGSQTHIDVRGLAPPQPLVAILRLVRSAQPGMSVVVHHDRDPMLLYPELAELGWGASRIPGDPGELRLLLQRLP